ncbi:MAG TPA: hypothetical protein VLX68_06935 [Chitinivibrionales bacterium]|nr:hypothetical protein [Chitinivibrionales bacterium]
MIKSPVRHLSILSLLLFFALPALGQPQSQVLAPPEWQAQADSAKKDTAALAQRGIQTVDEKGKIKIVKRKIDYTHFVILAVGMMAFVALILGTTQAWNPGGRAP